MNQTLDNKTFKETKMKRNRIVENVEKGDLESLVLPTISIAEFEPKTGTADEVMVLGFYVTDEEPAQDLASFIEKGVSGALDTEVSPNPNDSGYYMVFVEIENNNDAMKTVFDILLDTTRLTNIESWDFEFYSGLKTTIENTQIKEWLKSNR